MTSVYTAYHFNTVSLSGILSNMIVIPIISFITMPLLLIITIFSPIYLFDNLMFIEEKKYSIDTIYR